MSKDQVLSSETSAPPEKPIDHEEISGNQKIPRPPIVVIANGLQVKSNLNPNALEFYPTWILPTKVDKGKERNANSVVKEKFPIETLEEIKRPPCHYEIIQEICNKNDSLVEIIERPEKGLKMVTTIQVEEIIERKFSEDFEKSFLKQSKENEKHQIEKCKEPKKVMESESTNCEKSVSCKANKEELNSKRETTLKTKENLVKCREEKSIHKQLQKEVNIDPQVLFFGPATVKHTESDIELKQNKSSDIDRSTKIESVDQLLTGQYSDNTIIENTVVGDHTEANMNLQQINKVGESQSKKITKISDRIAPTSTTKLKGKIPSPRIAIPATLKGVSRTMAGNIKSTGTVKKLMSTTTSTTKETKVVFSASTARKSLITPRQFPSTLEAKKNETSASNLSKLSTTTKKINLQSKSYLISSSNCIKTDVLAKSKTKDSISLRSTCSTDKNSLSNKSSSLSSTAKVLPSSKVLEKSISKSSTKPIEKTGGVKKTDYLQRSPGGTVSSNLRKTETQKRQNLFPDSDAIKMTETLFK